MVGGSVPAGGATSQATAPLTDGWVWLMLAADAALEAALQLRLTF
jgi:hypothetical protein